MTMYKIPLTTGAQSFSINLGDVQYRMTLIYRSAECGGWFLDMERSDKKDAIYGIPLVLGVDLLEQHVHKGFGHLYVSMDGCANHQPTYEDMGNSVILTWTADDAERSQKFEY